VLEQLRGAVYRAHADDFDDGELLAAFVARRDEQAFAALVQRHGPMVLGVCRRLLRNVHDAEDAFQAVFLVLVRRAEAVRPREAVGNWLYGVAYRTALEARRRAARQRTREKQVTVMPEPPVHVHEAWYDVQPWIDQELTRLPDKYRQPVVLCDLEGRTRKEAARQLNLPEGTLSNRLASARQLLAGRLARHGVSLSAAALAALLVEEAQAVEMPATLAASTSQAVLGGQVPATVVSLAEGVLSSQCSHPGHECAGQVEGARPRRDDRHR
jgi:RNA polymerase sigma factor (sigma-70 family)